MTKLNVQAEYIIDPEALRIPTLPGSSYENTEGFIAVPTNRGVVLSISADLPDGMDLDTAVRDVLEAFDEVLEEITFEADWDSIPDLPVDLRIIDIDQLVADLRIKREDDKPEPPTPALAAA